jgi:hypothetical protein
MSALGSRRNAIMLTVGWWLLRRKLRRRAGAAVAGLLAGEGLSLAAPRRKRHRLRNLVLSAPSREAAASSGSGRGAGHDDDWVTWEPEPRRRSRE